MSRPRVFVQLCVVNMTTHQYGPHPTSNLLGVDYFRAYPPDTEFPRTIGRLDLFVRFLLRPPNATDPFEIAVHVHRLNPDGTDRQQVNNFRFPVQVGQDAVAHDHVFRLVNIQIPGEGQYAVRVCRWGRHSWKGEGWRVLATDYFLVIRS